MSRRYVARPERVTQSSLLLLFTATVQAMKMKNKNEVRK